MSDLLVALKKKIKYQVNLYFYGENQLYIKELTDLFEENTHYNFSNYTSWLKLITNIPLKPLYKKGIHIALLAFNFDAENKIDGKTGYEIIHEIKLLSHDMEIILISNGEDKNLVDLARNISGVTLVRKNENSFVRIHNHIKRIRSSIILKKKKKNFTTIRNILFSFLSLLLLSFIFLFIYDPSFFIY